MSANPDTFYDRMHRLMQIQLRSFEPVRIFGGLAVDTLEQMIRKNHAVMGDFIEFSVKQAHLPLSAENAGDVISVQMAELNAFNELMRSRTSEYIDMTSAFVSRMRQAADDATAAVRAA